jgi:transposase
MLRLHLQQVTALEATVAELDAGIEEQLRPFRGAIDLLVTIPGVKATAAAMVVAEIGTSMSRFPTPGHLLSWAGLCPLDESAGKRRSTRTRRGRWLKTTLVQTPRFFLGGRGSQRLQQLT